MTESSDSRRQAQFVRAQLVQLIIQQATIFTNWVKFAITVQAGLAAGLGAVLATSALAKHRLLGLTIAFFGIAAAGSFAKILVRHVQWTRWYGNSLLDRFPKIFPSEPTEVARGNSTKEEWKDLGRVGRVKEQYWKQLGPVIRSVVIFLSLLAIAWTVVFVWILWLPRLSEPSAQPPNPAFSTWNNCPPNFTVQDGLCKPYRGRYTKTRRP
jgi:hypothetical protein